MNSTAASHYQRRWLLNTVELSAGPCFDLSEQSHFCLLLAREEFEGATIGLDIGLPGQMNHRGTRLNSHCLWGLSIRGVVGSCLSYQRCGAGDAQTQCCGAHQAHDHPNSVRLLEVHKNRLP